MARLHSRAMRTGLFNHDAPLWRAMATLYDVVIVNLLTLACALPVVTVGAALSAAHDSARRSLAGEGGSIARTYVAAFRSNLRAATMLWLAAALALAATASAWWLSRASSGALPAAVLLTVIVLPTWTLLWAVQARFDNPWHRTLRIAFLLAFGNLGWTALVLVVDGGLVAIAIGTAFVLPQALPLVGILGVGAIVFGHTPLIERIFAPHVAAAS